MKGKTTLAGGCIEIREDEIYKAYKIFFGTLVSEDRLKIINLLRKGNMNVSEMVKKLRIERTTLSHNLARLKKCGFVNSKRKWRFVEYSLNKKTIEPIMKLIDNHVGENCIHILREKER